MYPNHIPHNHLPLEELLNVKVQRGYSNNPQRAGIQWEGHDAKPETDVRILDASYSFILTWTDLFKIGTPRDLGLTDLLSECFDPGKQYSYYMDFADPNSVIITKKGNKIEKYTPSANQNNSQNKTKGKKVGTAYQLEDGQIIYIED